MQLGEGVVEADGARRRSPMRWRPGGKATTAPAAGPASTVTTRWPSASLHHGASTARSARQVARVDRQVTLLPLTMPERSSRTRRSTAVPVDQHDRTARDADHVCQLADRVRVGRQVDRDSAAVRPADGQRRRRVAIAGRCGVEIEFRHTPPGRRTSGQTESELRSTCGADQDL